MSVNPIPEDHQTVVPYLVIRDVTGLIDFLKQVFDARETELLKMPDGRIMHAEVIIGDSVIMMGEASQQIVAMPAMLYVYVEDTDAAYRRALEAGATSLQEPLNEFYGHRTAGVKDAYGNQWWLAMPIEEVTAEEIQRRVDALNQQS